LSVEKKLRVWVPSLEWSAGAGTSTLVPLWALSLSTW
jgi:hypothetical protein